MDSKSSGTFPYQVFHTNEDLTLGVHMHCDGRRLVANLDNV